MSTEAIRAELIRRWRERVCDGNPDGAAVGDGAALLFMEMVMDAQELLTRSTFDRFTSIAQACNVVTSAAGMANRAPAVPSPTPKLLTTEAGAVLVAWLPGYDDPIAWWATDDRAAFTVALVSCAIDQRRAQTDPADEQPTDHEIARDFRAAVRIEAVKP